MPALLGRERQSINPRSMQMAVAFRTSRKCGTRGPDVALFPNVLLGVHNDHYFNIILTPDGTSRTNEQIEIYYADEAARGRITLLCCDQYRNVENGFSEDIQVVEECSWDATHLDMMVENSPP